MKIAQVSLQFEATTTGGGGVHVEKITEHLMERGHRVTVISIHISKTLGHARLIDGPYPYSLELTLAGIPTGSYLELLEEEAGGASGFIPIELRTFEAISTVEERNALLDEFQIYLFPTLNEPFGITILEAGARGLVIITTDAVGPRYILDSQQVHEAPWGYVTDFGICAKRTSDPARNLARNLSQAIRWALDDWPESVGRALALRGRIEEKYTRRGVTQAYLREYNALMSK